MKLMRKYQCPLSHASLSSTFMRFYYFLSVQVIGKIKHTVKCPNDSTRHVYRYKDRGGRNRSGREG